MAEELRLELSNNMVETYRRCPQKWWYRYVERLRKLSPGLPLKRGDWLHQMLEAHYTGRSWKAVHKELAREFQLYSEEEREEYGDLPGETRRIMNMYLSYWEDEDEALNVVAAELDEAIRLPSGKPFRVIIDLIIEHADGSLWIWDHKTVANFMDPQYLLMQGQLARYFWAVEQMGYDVSGVLFNEVRTKAPTVPQELKAGGLTKRADLDTTWSVYLREIKRLGLDARDYADVKQRLEGREDRWFRRTPLARSDALVFNTLQELEDTAEDITSAAERGSFPRTAKRDCSWDCDFSQICFLELEGLDTNTTRKQFFEVEE